MCIKIALHCFSLLAKHSHTPLPKCTKELREFCVPASIQLVVFSLVPPCAPLCPLATMHGIYESVFCYELMYIHRFTSSFPSFLHQKVLYIDSSFVSLCSRCGEPDHYLHGDAAVRAVGQGGPRQAVPLPTAGWSLPRRTRRSS